MIDQTHPSRQTIEAVVGIVRRERGVRAHDVVRHAAKLLATAPRQAESALRLLRKQQAIAEDEAGCLTLQQPPDWGLALARRRHELSRLDAMDAYARTGTCRRGFVLRYFGDPSAMQHCGACDNCIRQKPYDHRGSGPFASLRRLLHR